MTREEAIDVLKHNYPSTCFTDLCEAVEIAIQALSAQPQRMRGRWVEVTDGICIWKVCDQCGKKPLWNEWKTDRDESPYCPNCGADMREGEG